MDDKKKTVSPENAGNPATFKQKFLIGRLTGIRVEGGLTMAEASTLIDRFIAVAKAGGGKIEDEATLLIAVKYPCFEPWITKGAYVAETKAKREALERGEEPAPEPKPDEGGEEPPKDLAKLRAQCAALCGVADGATLRKVMRLLLK